MHKLRFQESCILRSKTRLAKYKDRRKRKKRLLESKCTIYARKQPKMECGTSVQTDHVHVGVEQKSEGNETVLSV